MSDNTVLSTNIGSGDTVRDKDRSGVKTQIIGLDIGIGSATETLMTIGQKAMAASIGVVLASDQSAIPVTGTFYQATQPVSIAGTVVVSAASLPLPSGASTAAKQPALGTAGSASTDVITIQGIASMTALKVDGSAVTQPVSIASVPSHAVTNAGTFVIQIDGTALTRLTDIETNTDSGAVVGNGAAATAQRVTLANDSTGIVSLTTSTASIGKLAANSGVDIGDVDVTSVPTDPFGVNADAGSSTGSISAKLRFIAATGIPITGTVTVGAHAVTNAGTFAVQAAQSGTWNVGTVTTVTTVSAVTAITNALPAGTNLIGKVSASPETSTVYNGATALTPVFLFIDKAGSGDNELKAADATKKIRVLQCMLVAGGTVNVRFESGAGGTALTGQMQLTAQNGFCLPFSPIGWFETAANESLNLELSGAVSVDGVLAYILV